MSLTLVLLLIETAYKGDVIAKDVVHVVKVTAHLVKHPKKAIVKPVATVKEVKR